MTNAELITELTYHANIEKRKLLSDAAAALEAADKRIAELEAQLPKEGEWIDIDGTMFAECSVCGKRHYGCTTPYCDMCGARMKGEQE